ncbi:VWA domain-containing protein [Nitrosomonas sp. JL21]|uniref:vWA domain-containing protein n=1 Tax=Nitrosomonas sp. JL21 TaxID=153949 RepID=UPI0013703DAE|nr:vWA domain-containing protein [Nitrosomonas sp. JL21]MXS77908.1 VWA domain-containing protein [Nitrosomonas sp. JL21]
MKLTTLLLFTALSGVAYAQKPTHITFVLDQSSSNPNEVEAFRNTAGRHAKNTVTELNMGDSVAVMTFGDGGLSNFQLTKRVKLSMRMRPSQVGLALEKAITAKAEEAAKNPQNETRLMSFFEDSYREFQCGSGNAKVIVFTDGVEHSAEISAKQFVVDKKQLPNPTPDILKGCHVEFIGVGIGAKGSLQRLEKKHITDAWSAWMKKAGATFEARSNL